MAEKRNWGVWKLNGRYIAVRLDDPPAFGTRIRTKRLTHKDAMILAEKRAAKLAKQLGRVTLKSGCTVVVTGARKSVYKWHGRNAKRMAGVPA